MYPNDFSRADNCGNRIGEDGEMSDIQCSDVMIEELVGPINETMGHVASSIHNHLYSTLADSGFDVFLYTHSQDGETLEAAWEFLRPHGQTSLSTDGLSNGFYYEVDDPETSLSYMHTKERMSNYVFGHAHRGIQYLLWQVDDSGPLPFSGLFPLLI